MWAIWVVIPLVLIGILGISESFAESHVMISENTNNPNECWYQDEKGNMSPCKIEGGPDMIVMFMIIFGPWILLGGAIGIIVIFWRMRK